VVFQPDSQHCNSCDSTGAEQVAHSTCSCTRRNIQPPSCVHRDRVARN